MCAGVWAVTISAMSVSKGEGGKGEERPFFHRKTTGGLRQTITRPVLSRARELSVFLKSADIITTQKTEVSQKSRSSRGRETEQYEERTL